MRKNYIDNLRTMVIILLFIFHTCRMYTGNIPFYVEGKPNVVCELIVSFLSIWFMNLLFVLAGMSTYFSLKKRSIREYLKERLSRLFVPFVFGVIFTIPIQTYFAEKFHNGYTGGFFQQYKLFFTKITDLTGYYGGLTPAHLWFLLFLFIISIITVPIVLYIKKKYLQSSKKYWGLLRLMTLFIFPCVFSAIEIGETIGQYAAYFVIGLTVLSNDLTLNEVKKNKGKLTIVAIILCVLSTILNYYIPLESKFSILAIALSALRHFTSWITILALIGNGMKYLNFSNKYTKYMAKNSFPIYVVHQTILVAIGYFVINLTSKTLIQMPIIMVSTFILSILVTEIVKRSKITRFLFGM